MNKQEIKEYKKRILINDAILKIFDAAIREGYFLDTKGIYWTGFFMGKVDMAKNFLSISHKDKDEFYSLVMIASHELYLVICNEEGVKDDDDGMCEDEMDELLEMSV